MRWKLVQEIMKIQLLYSSDELMQQRLREKQAKGKKINIPLKILNTNIFSALFYSFIFGGLALIANIAKNPAAFSNLMFVFMVLILSQGFLQYYSAFYESQDQQFLRPYPIGEGELFLAKGFSVLTSTLTGLLPMMVNLIILPLQAGHPIWFSILLSLALIVVVVSSLYLSVIVGTHFLVKTALFRRFQRTISGILTTLVFISSFAIFFFIPTDQRKHSIFDAIPIFRLLHQIALKPFSISSLFSFFIWTLLTLILVYLFIKKVLVEFYEVTLAASKKPMIRQKKQAPIRNFNQFIWRYQWRLATDAGTLLVVVLFGSAYPYFLLLPGSLGARDSMDWTLFQDPLNIIPLFLIFAGITILQFGGLTLASVGISLERENFIYLRTLPIALDTYLKRKFWILHGLSLILPSLLFIGVALYLGLPFYLILLFLFGMQWIALPLSLRAFEKDLRNFKSDWNNLFSIVDNQKPNFWKKVLHFIGFISYLLIVVFSFGLAQILQPFLNYSLAALMFLMLPVVSLYLTKKLFAKLNESIEEVGRQ